MARVRVHALRCGTVGTDETIPDRSRSRNPLAYTGVLRGERHRVWLPVYCYLIEHPAGEAVSEQLGRLGIAPTDLDMVFLTHLAVDHASGVRLVAGAHRICANRAELAAASRGELRYNRRLWEGVDVEPVDLGEMGVGPSGRGLDVFGDGAVVLVDLAGHSAGMTGVLARGGGRFVLLTGDACYDHASWEELRLPGITWDADRAMAALRWVQGMAADPACAEILATHDPEVEPHVVSLG